METIADSPTDLYGSSQEKISSEVETSGYAREEYGLVDGRLPVTRAEHDDGAAIIDGRPVDIRGRSVLRVRYISPFNFLIAPNNSPINNKEFDDELEKGLNAMLQGSDVFEAICSRIRHLPWRG